MIRKPVAFLAALLLGMFAVFATYAWAQDGSGTSSGGSGGATTTEPAADSYVLETGSVFGPIAWGNPGVPVALSEFNPFDGQHYDVTPGELASLEVPPGVESALDFQRVTAAWPSTKVEGRVNVEVHDCSIEAAMVWSVEDDPTPELITRRTFRVYLKAEAGGGYVIGLGKAHGKGGAIQRWQAVRHFGRMPAYVGETEKE